MIEERDNWGPLLTCPCHICLIANTDDDIPKTVTWWLRAQALDREAWA